MTEVKIYCNAECKYNEGHCTHPENLDKGCYGGIDRVYVEKCDLQKPKEERGTMSKYIDADALIEHLEDNLRECGKKVKYLRECGLTDKQIERVLKGGAE